MAENAIIIFQGGGALGAYECGAYKALAPYLKERHDRLAIVAGTSIGAINASLVAKYQHQGDNGVALLESFWREGIAQPLHPLFTLLPDPYGAVWNSLLFGNPRLFKPFFAGWPFIPPIGWLPLHFYDSNAMATTLGRNFGGYSGREPLLIVTAVDIEAGTSVAFHSGDKEVSVEHVMASCAFAPWLQARKIDNRSYWDGGFWSNTPLRETLSVLQDTVPDGERFSVYLIDVFPREGKIPQNLWELQGRLSEISFGDKAVLDEKNCDQFTSYIEFVDEIYQLSQKSNDPLRKRIEQEYQELHSMPRFPLRITRIQRSALPDEHVAREIDFSPERINALIEQGYRDALKQLGATRREHDIPIPVSL